MNYLQYKKNIAKLITIILTVTPLIIFPFYINKPIIYKLSIDNFMLPKVIFLYITVFLSLGISIYGRFSDINFEYKCEKLTEGLVGLYVILLILSTIFSINPYQSLKGQTMYEEGLISILIYVFMYLLAKRFYSYEERQLSFVLFSSAILGLYGLIQYFGIDLIRTEMTGTVYATFRNPNYYGAYLVLMLPVSIFAYIKSSHKLYLLVTGLLYFCLLATNTRGSWLGFLVSMLVIAYYIKQMKYNSRRLINILILLGIITIAFNLLNDNRFITRFLSIFSDLKSVVSQAEKYEIAGSNRILIWKGALQIVKENPFFGTGIETFSTVFYDKFSVNFFKAHNEYLNIAQSSGIPSLIVYLIWLVTVMRVGFKAVKKKIIALPLLASVIGYAVQAFFNVSVVAVAYIFWIFCGILVNFSDDKLHKCSNSDLICSKNTQGDGSSVSPV